MTDKDLISGGRTMERPILFSTSMVQAILEGKKNQTRRVIKPQPGDHPGDNGYLSSILERCPYGKPGDTLWIRETWCRGKARNDDNKTIYKADIETDLQSIHDWKPSIYMPKDYARLFLTVKNVRVEKLQDISEEDAKAEGVTAEMEIRSLEDKSVHEPFGYRLAFTELWDSINKARGYGWDTNPWIWVVKFERIAGEPNDR